MKVQFSVKPKTQSPTAEGQAATAEEEESMSETGVKDSQRDTTSSISDKSAESNALLAV